MQRGRRRLRAGSDFRGFRVVIYCFSVVFSKSGHDLSSACDVFGGGGGGGGETAAALYAARAAAATAGPARLRYPSTVDRCEV